MSYRVEVYPNDGSSDEPLVYEGITSVTTIDANSHGQGPIGELSNLGSGKRLIVASPNVVAVLVERQ